MNQDEIIRMAREAGMQLAWIATVPGPNKMKVLCDFDQAQRFAALVAAAEREACVQLCERMARRTDDIRRAALETAAENIRARGQDPMPLFDDWDKDWTK